MPKVNGWWESRRRWVCFEVAEGERLEGGWDKKVDLPTSESPRSRTVVSIGGGPSWVSFMVDSMNG